ncbi:UDP-glucose 4-epimerase family protein [Vibrio pectenicida]|uniref:UDP-glucose 4-epimerase family protein n=1 Tax=Vibrio pectenicida TaxID=62763 RepID=UPI003B995D79
MKILLTGSTGFVGSRVGAIAHERDWDVCAVVRQQVQNRSAVCVADIGPETDWSGFLQDIDCIVHCAAIVHQMCDKNCLVDYRTVNTLGTLNLAKQAAEAGVKRFVFLSSIKVNGEYTEPDSPFRPEILTPPTDAYGLSKYDAEVALKKLSDETGFEVVIIRPPLVYGPGVKANFLSMLNWTKKQLPLPLGAINNRRSLVYVDNLADLILECCVNPRAQSKVFMVSDDHDVSTTELLNCVAKHMGKRSVLIPIPSAFLQNLCIFIGKKDIGRRLCSSLHVDVSETKNILNWQPPYSFEQGIVNTVLAYLSSQQQLGKG